ncbi:MAG: chemotaxis protein CheA [Romboutsia sp.]|nr:chemotaxis protein CheA [Romboutsia sp.]
MSGIDSMTEFYVYENMQLLEQLEEILLSGQSDTGELSQEEIEEIFRAMHTIKGSSAMMGYDSLMNLTHSIEDVFDEIRGGRVLSQSKWEEVIDVVLAIIDFLKDEISKVQEGLFPQASIDELYQKSSNLLKDDVEEKVDEAIEETTTEDTVVDLNSNSMQIKVFFEDGCGMESIRALGLIMSLEGMHSSIKTVPESLEDDCDEEIAKNGLLIVLENTNDKEAIEKCVQGTMFLKSYEIQEPNQNNNYDNIENHIEEALEEQQNIEVKEEIVVEQVVTEEAIKEQTIIEEKIEEVVVVEQPKEEKVVEKKQLQSSNNKNNFLTVNISKIDMLMNLVGEIVTTESMVEKQSQAENFDRDTFEKQARRLHQLTNELQDVVMSIRMVPISSTFTKMQRVVRDMSKKTGKIVDLVLIGEQTEVDKTILENISDPLMHMIRNSMDHGVETPEERKEKGKPEKATVTLEAKNTGGDVVIIIKDDGRGLNKEAIVNKAIEKGITNKKLEEISDKEAYNFIMAPGFSTKEAVTEYSGRGVGMDVVHTNIKKLRGSITIDSESGKGTMFVIRIPLTLAIIDGMKVEIGDETYIIPSLNIKEVFTGGSYEIVKNPNGEEHSIIRGNCYKIHRLSDILGIENKANNEGIMILVESEIGNICIIVDRIIGQQNVVIKPIPQLLTQFEKVQSYMSGCSILEDGSISLIFDVNSIITR